MNGSRSEDASRLASENLFSIDQKRRSAICWHVFDD
jgi:hypothetical protein